MHSRKASQGRAKRGLQLFSPYKGWRAEVWLYTSSFGIIFALLSWLELAQLEVLRPILSTKLRGFFALVLGCPFYLFIGREM